jgi:hypothetical protein
MPALSSWAGPSRAALLLIAALSGCGESDAPDDKIDPARAPEIVRIVSAEEALAGAVVAKLDPETMNDAELREGVGIEPRCEFRYTRAGRPVLAAGMKPNEPPARGIVKLNGSMIVLDAASPDGAAEPSGAFRLVAGPIRIAVTPHGEPEEGRDGVLHRDATLVFEVDRSLRVGYRGYLDCTSQPPVASARH